MTLNFKDSLNGKMAIILRYFTGFGSLRGYCVKVVEGIPELSAKKM